MYILARSVKIINDVCNLNKTVKQYFWWVPRRRTNLKLEIYRGNCIKRYSQDLLFYIKSLPSSAEDPSIFLLFLFQVYYSFYHYSVFIQITIIHKQYRNKLEKHKSKFDD